MAKSRNWVYTKFLNETEVDECIRDPMEFTGDINTHRNILYHAWQIEECPDSKRLHIQGYIELKVNLGLKATKEILWDGTHLEIRKGSQDQAKAYVMKKETRYAGPWEFGHSKKQGRRNDLENIYSRLKQGVDDEDLLEGDPSTYLKYYKALDRAREILLRKSAMNFKASERKKKLRVIALIGSPGTGKTRYAYDRHTVENIYSLPNTKNNWFNGYIGQPILLIDEMGPNRIDIDKLLTILDIYPQQYEIKGGMTWGKWEIVYITSNYTIDQWYPDLPKIKIDALKRRIHEIKSFPKVIDYESFIDENSVSDSSSESD